MESVHKRITLKDNPHYRVHIPGIFKPDMEICKTVLRVGMPVTFEQVSIQSGYMLANTLCVGLGTQAASAYQIVNTLTNFAGLPQSICMSVIMTVVGQHIGAKRHGEAKKSASRISLACFAMCMALGLIVAIFGKPLSLLYTTDVGLADTCSILLWMMLVYQATGSLINTNDPALKVGTIY